MEKGKLLVIDDEQVINDAVRKIVLSEGFSVDTVTNAEEALALLKKKNYNLALCDIMMPGIDGLQLLDEVRKRNILTPIIIFSGYSTVENAVISLYKGAIDFVPKPFTFDELISSVTRGFNYGKIRDEIVRSDRDSIVYVPCPPKYLKLGDLAWMHMEGEGVVAIGATDLFLKTISTVEKIELLNTNDILIQANASAKFICDDELVHNLLAPVGGKIIERNENLLVNPSLLEKDPYFKGWIYKVIPSNIEYDTKYLIPCSSEWI